MDKDETTLLPISSAGAGDQTEPDVETFEVVLLKPHTHAREDFQPGAKIKVTAAQRIWLQSLGVVVASTPEK